MNEEELKKFYQTYKSERDRLNKSTYVLDKIYNPETVADAAVYATKRKVKEQEKDPVENDEYLSGYNDGFNDAKNKYQCSNIWIKFSIKKPPLNTPVLVLFIIPELYSKGKQVKVITFTANNTIGNELKNAELIAWRPVPSYDNIEE